MSNERGDSGLGICQVRGLFSGCSRGWVTAGLFEDLLGEVFCGVGFEEGMAAVTAKGDEVEIAGLLISFETYEHGGI